MEQWLKQRTIAWSVVVSIAVLALPEIAWSQDNPEENRDFVDTVMNVCLPLVQSRQSVLENPAIHGLLREPDGEARFTHPSGNEGTIWNLADQADGGVTVLEYDDDACTVAAASSTPRLALERLVQTLLAVSFVEDDALEERRGKFDGRLESADDVFVELDGFSEGDPGIAIANVGR